MSERVVHQCGLACATRAIHNQRRVIVHGEPLGQLLLNQLTVDKQSWRDLRLNTALNNRIGIKIAHGLVHVIGGGGRMSHWGA